MILICMGAANIVLLNLQHLNYGSGFSYINKIYHGKKYKHKEGGGIGVHAKMLGHACAQLNPLAANHDTAVILINQLRVNLSSYGAPEIRPGGGSGGE
jgi:RecA/RadA recombinase